MCWAPGLPATHYCLITLFARHTPSFTPRHIYQIVNPIYPAIFCFSLTLPWKFIRPYPTWLVSGHISSQLFFLSFTATVVNPIPWVVVHLQHSLSPIQTVCTKNCSLSWHAGELSNELDSHFALTYSGKFKSSLLLSKTKKPIKYKIFSGKIKF
jgi:hypothetical protein